jgi:hypothetical protein
MASECLVAGTLSLGAAEVPRHRAGATYTRQVFRPAIPLIVVLMILTACAGFDPRPQGRLTLYGRNEAPGMAWFGVTPTGDPPETVGFGADIGVACLTGPAGSDLVAYDGDPTAGGQPGRLLGRVPGDANELVLWVDVAGDGTLTTGNGVPAWWVGDGQAC